MNTLARHALRSPAPPVLLDLCPTPDDQIGRAHV